MRNSSAKVIRTVLHGSDVKTCIAVDGSYLVVGCRDSTIYVYDIKKNISVKSGTEKDPFRAPMRILYGFTICHLIP